MDHFSLTCFQNGNYGEDAAVTDSWNSNVSALPFVSSGISSTGSGFVSDSETVFGSTSAKAPAAIAIATPITITAITDLFNNVWSNYCRINIIVYRVEVKMGTWNEDFSHGSHFYTH